MPISAPPVCVEYTPPGATCKAMWHPRARLQARESTHLGDTDTTMSPWCVAGLPRDLRARGPDPHRGEGIAMAAPLIAAVRARRDLKESVLHTAQELAHRASIYGVARVSLSYLALKCHCCKQTIINHLKTLIALKILRKHTIWIQ